MWIASMRRCFSARAGARFWQKMAVYGRCQQLNAGSGALPWDGVGLAAFWRRARDVGRSVWISWRVAVSLRKARHERWISLDFLGFSRPNRDFSMGYAERTSESFSCSLFRPEQTALTVSGMRKRRIVHGGKLNSISDFLQEIVVPSSLSAAFRQNELRPSRA